MARRLGLAAVASLLMCSLVAAQTDTGSRLETFDFVFLGPQGAVFIRLHLDTGQRSVTEVRREFAASIFRGLDANGDERLDAEEAAQIPSNGQSAASGTLGTNWTQLDRDPEDGSVSGGELFAFVDQQLGERLKFESATRLSQSAELGMRLDADGDEQVSRAEIEAGLGQLKPFDFDDDETVSVAELQPFPTAILLAAQQEREQTEPTVPLAGLVTEEERTAAVDRILRVYGENDAVPLDKVGITLGAGERADKNQDGRLDRTELAALVESPAPAVELIAALRRNLVALMPKTETGTLAAELPRDRTIPRDMQLQLAGMDVGVSAVNDVQAGMSNATLNESFYLQRFVQFDADKNKYLDMAEFASLGLPNADFNGVDRDSDGMVTRDELKAHLELQSSLLRASVVLTISDDAKTLFEILDADIDNRLTPREFQRGYGEMRKYDHDRDGMLAMGELRSRYGFKVTQAQPEFLQNPFQDTQMAGAARQPRPRPQTAGPIWFRKMDRNQDGDLTWREFLGPREEFAKIDSDRNGLIDLNEATVVQ